MPENGEQTFLHRCSYFSIMTIATHPTFQALRLSLPPQMRMHTFSQKFASGGRYWCKKTPLRPITNVHEGPGEEQKLKLAH